LAVKQAVYEAEQMICTANELLGGRQLCLGSGIDGVVEGWVPPSNKVDAAFCSAYFPLLARLLGIKCE
jgi:hypothetical protein